MKVLFLLAGLSAAACALPSPALPEHFPSLSFDKASKGFDIALGDIDDDTWILWSEEVKVPYDSLWPWSKLQTSFSYRLPLDPNHPAITAVRTFDQNLVGQAAAVTKIDGGVGHDHVSIDFEGARGYGINVLVIVYGKYSE